MAAHTRGGMGANAFAIGLPIPPETIDQTRTRIVSGFQYLDA